MRSALYDCRAEVLPETMVKNDRTVNSTEDGGAEIDAAEAFSQVIKAVDDVLKKCPTEIAETEYVAASCFWHSLIGIDKNGEPTTPVFTWAETRPAHFVQKLRDDLNESAIHNRTGCRFHSSYWTAKLLWLRRERPKIFKKTVKWLSFCDYVALQLCGEAKTSVSMASGTGLLDIRNCVWDKKLLEYLGLRSENLPELVENDAVTFKLNSEYSKRWKPLENTKWFPAIGDGAANNLGAGCVEKSKAALMIGTSGAMRVAFAGNVPAKIPSGLWCYRIDRQRLIIGGALSDGGGLYRWLKDNLKLVGTDNEIESEIEKRAADAHGLTFLPFLAGERSTGYHESAHGAVLGLKSATDATDIVQSALEAVAYRFADIFEQLNKVSKIDEIIASGGALRESPVWTQIIADVLVSNMSLPDVREASSRGAVLLALETIGKLKNVEKQKTPKGQQFKFDKKKKSIYQKARKRHQKFYNLLVK